MQLRAYCLDQGFLNFSGSAHVTTQINSCAQFTKLLFNDFLNSKVIIFSKIARPPGRCGRAHKLRNPYRVFARRVNTFVTLYFQFFYNIKIATNEFIYSKFCEDSEYAHFKKLKLSQKVSELSNQDLVDFALAHSKFIL